MIEDVAIALGRAIDKLLGDRTAIARFGWAAVPMDDALALATVDLGGRPYWVVKARLPDITIGGGGEIAVLDITATPEDGGA